MKRIAYYIVIMVIAIIVLPMFIVKSCGFAIKRGKLDKIDSQSINERQEVNQVKWGDSKGNIKINIYIKSEDKIKEMEIEEYLLGVIAAEMPAEFAFEALKAQAVAARTYAYGRLRGIYKGKDNMHPYADICTDPTHCQAWISKEEAIERWDILSSDEYWNKIKRSVEDTEGMIILYQGIITNPVFHSNSGGKTENAEEVWNVEPVDYLKSVISQGEEVSPSFKAISKISTVEFYNTLKEYYPNIKINKNSIFEDIKIIERTQGDRVKTIKIGDIEIKGTDFRKMFSLPSANFELNKNKDGMIEIITFGSGHGVGMSQWGANSLAKDGKTWEEIIKHYYQGVEIETISNVENLLAE